MGEFYRVFGQLLGKWKWIDVSEPGVPVHDALILSDGVALLSKDLDQQDFGFDVGYDT